LADSKIVKNRSESLLKQ